MNVLSSVHLLVPRLESSIGGKNSTPEQRRRYARGPNCLIASEAARTILELSGIEPIRREFHRSHEPRMDHAFVSLREMGQPLGMDDILVDPTYLQFVDHGVNIEKLPNIFVGTRGEILELMTNRDFTSRPEAVDLYCEQTWLPAKN